MLGDVLRRKAVKRCAISVLVRLLEDAGGRVMLTQREFEQLTTHIVKGRYRLHKDSVGSGVGLRLEDTWHQGDV